FSISRYDFSQQIRQNDRTAKINPNITYPQAKSFQEKYHFPGSAVSLSFTAASKIEVKYGSEKTDPEISVLGVDHNFMGNSGLETTSGRNFTTFDIQNNNYVCIVGSDFEKGLLKDINPIGKTISIRGARFKVIGVLKEQGSTFGNRQDLRVLLPIQVARSLFTAPNINYDIKVKTQNKDMLDGSIDEATITMRRVRKLNPVEDNNFGIARSDELLQRLMSQI